MSFSCTKVNKTTLNCFMATQNTILIIYITIHLSSFQPLANFILLHFLTNTTPTLDVRNIDGHICKSHFFCTIVGICRPYVEMAVYNLTSKEASLRDSEIIRFCNDSFQNVPSRNGIEPLKSMVRIQNRTNNAERIECPFYGDYIFSYKGNEIKLNSFTFER